MITTERSEFIAGHVTPATKEALRREAQKSRVSMSRLLSTLIAEKLRERGHEIPLEEEQA